ncbi:MAG TPA: pentapeptide repeat-containing protein [Rhizomicrobium sp.]|nr:pentapeptide repeat-containing protein [Rhizomicrobium sp.]
MIALLMVLAAAPAAQAAVPVPDAAAVARIKTGVTDCVKCDLRGADLSHQCVKTGDLSGARFDGASLVMMCMSYANFSGASFRGADLAGANLAHAKLDGADFTGANLAITSFKGADLSHAHGLSQAQLDQACSDNDTKPPAGMTTKTCL